MPLHDLPWLPRCLPLALLTSALVVLAQPASPQNFNNFNDYVVDGFVTEPEGRPDIDDVLLILKLERFGRTIVHPLKLKQHPSGLLYFEQVLGRGVADNTVTFSVDPPYSIVAVRPQKKFILTGLDKYSSEIEVKKDPCPYVTSVEWVAGVRDSDQTSLTEIEKAIQIIHCLNSRSPSFQTLNLLPALLNAFFHGGGSADDIDFVHIYFIDRNDGFSSLSPQRKIWVLSNLAHALSNPAVLKEKVEDQYVVGDMALDFVAQALAIAEDQANKISHSVVASLHQHRYKLNCALGNSFTCIGNIKQYLSSFGPIANDRTVRAFFSDWLVELSKLTSAVDEAHAAYPDFPPPDTRTLVGAWCEYNELASQEILNRHWIEPRFGNLRHGQKEANRRCAVQSVEIVRD